MTRDLVFTPACEGVFACHIWVGCGRVVRDFDMVTPCEDRRRSTPQKGPTFTVSPMRRLTSP